MALPRDAEWIITSFNCSQVCLRFRDLWLSMGRFSFSSTKIIGQYFMAVSDLFCCRIQKYSSADNWRRLRFDSGQSKEAHWKRKKHSFLFGWTAARVSVFQSPDWVCTAGGLLFTAPTAVLPSLLTHTLQQIVPLAHDNRRNTLNALQKVSRPIGAWLGLS